jgi:hypothetical protein
MKAAGRKPAATLKDVTDYSKTRSEDDTNRQGVYMDIH